jgi:hypothetical protein
MLSAPLWTLLGVLTVGFHGVTCYSFYYTDWVGDALFPGTQLRAGYLAMAVRRHVSVHTRALTQTCSQKQTQTDRRQTDGNTALRIWRHCVGALVHRIFSRSSIAQCFNADPPCARTPPISTRCG